MKEYLVYLAMATAIITFGACSSDNDNEPKMPETETPDGGGEDITEDPDNPNNPESDSKILVAVKFAIDSQDALAFSDSPARFSIPQ